MEQTNLEKPPLSIRPNVSKVSGAAALERYDHFNYNFIIIKRILFSANLVDGSRTLFIMISRTNLLYNQYLQRNRLRQKRNSFLSKMFHALKKYNFYLEIF